MAPEHRMLAVTIGQHSSSGRKPANQDFHGALVPDGGALRMKGVALALADGVSSSAVSHIAAETAVKSFLTDYYCTSDLWSVKTAGQRVIAAANSWLHAQTRNGTRDGTLGGERDRGYLCAFSALVLKGRQAHLFHVGDGRVHRLAGTTLEQLTTDHRVALSATESQLGRALGLDSGVDIDYHALDLRRGDTFVLTTDGVHEYLPPRRMAAILAESGDLDAAARAIVAAALEAGSHDNLTVQILRVESLPDPDAAGVLDLADTLPPAPLPRVPSDFDGYRIQRQIHASSRSHLFLATDLETGQPVALKVPSLDQRGDPAYRRRLAMEEWVARRLDAPHVLKAAPARGERASLYVVTEYVTGQTLRQWMVDHPRPDLETVRGIVEQIARGLRAFHRKDMLHQDLRPENVMIGAEGTVTLIDFGSVRVAGVLEAAPGLDDGEILGTHQYSAPEYFLGEPGTERSDLFSLGVIAYEMLTGRLPYGAAVSRARTVKAQGALRYVPAGTLTPGVPDWVDGALRRAVQPNPARRYEDVAEFIADLRRPNPAFLSRRFVPLAERDPVRFWRSVSALLALTALGLLIRLASP